MKDPTRCVYCDGKGYFHADDSADLALQHAERGRQHRLREIARSGGVQGDPIEPPEPKQ